MNSTGAAAGFFEGASTRCASGTVARTSTQIRTGRDHAAPSSTTGLVARWTLDDGSGAAVDRRVRCRGRHRCAPAGTGPTWIAGYGFPQDTTAPSTPSGLNATAGDSSVTLTWTALGPTAGVAGYDVYRSLTSPVPTTGSPLNGTDLARAGTFTDTTAAQRHHVPLRPRGGRWGRQSFELGGDLGEPRRQRCPGGHAQRAERRGHGPPDVGRPDRAASPTPRARPAPSRSSGVPTRAATSSSSASQSGIAATARPRSPGPVVATVCATSGT